MINSHFFPHTSYDIARMHCAFSFDISTTIKEPPKYLPNIPHNIQREESNKFFKKIQDTFPTRDTFTQNFPWNEKEHYKRFSQQTEDTVYNWSSELLILSHKSIPVPPSLMLKIEGGILETNLHNCGTPNLAVLMNKHGLHAIKTIYDAYEIDSTFLPRISFDREGMKFVVPFRLPEKNRDGIDYMITQMQIYKQSIPLTSKIQMDKNKISTITLDQNKTTIRYIDETCGEFLGFIPMTISDSKKRNTIAIHSFQFATTQAKALYELNEFE